MATVHVHPDVAVTLEALRNLGFTCTSTVVEADNAEYGAALASIGSSTARFRVGKVTPTKVGLFVAVWRRAPSGSTEPFPSERNTPALMVSAREGAHFGVFAFPAESLAAQGITSVNGRGGKRGFRVYPPWSAAANPQARRSQRWQCDYFLNIADGSFADPQRAHLLLDAPFKSSPDIDN